MLPLRLIECREGYKANVMQTTIWNRLAKWNRKNIEPGFEDGASIQIKLATGETVPAECACSKCSTRTLPIRTRRRLVCVHSSTASLTPSAIRPILKTNAVNLEHIAGSMLVTLDCTGLNQTSRNAMFMANRETFREDDVRRTCSRSCKKN